MNIAWDMDGTIANLYGVDNWLEMVCSEDTTPYETAEPLVNCQALARRLNTLQRKGAKIGIISWGSKDCSEEYLEKIRVAKISWLKKHFNSVKWDFVEIVAYGTPKSTCCSKDDINILFDDEENNLIEWKKSGGFAYDAKNFAEELENFNRLLKLFPITTFGY